MEKDSLEKPERICILRRRNYKIFADIGPDGYDLKSFRTILENGSGPTFTPSMKVSRRYGFKNRTAALPEICVAKFNPLKMFGVVTISLRLGLFFSAAVLIFCPILSAFVILGADYCKKLLEEIGPRWKFVELDDGGTVPIVRWPPKRNCRSPPLLPDLVCELYDQRLSQKVK